MPSRYVVVQVFATLGAMRQWAARHSGVVIAASGRRCTGKTRFRNALGLCRVAPGTREIATVSLAREYCGPRIVCHEFQHATMEYLRRYLLHQEVEGGNLLFGPLGERLADFNGNLASRFWARLRDAGLAP